MLHLSRATNVQRLDTKVLGSARVWEVNHAQSRKYSYSGLKMKEKMKKRTPFLKKRAPQAVRVAAKPGDLSSSPETHTVDKGSGSCRLFLTFI